MSRIAEAIIILILAWSIGTVMKELGSADYLIQALDGIIDPMWFPSLVFVLAAGIAFATGTSFGTMGTINAPSPSTGGTIWCQHGNYFGRYSGSPQRSHLGGPFASNLRYYCSIERRYRM